VRTLATVVAMSGGIVLDSDDLTLLSDERRKWLAMLLPPFGKSAQPVDLFDTDIPSVLRLDCGTHIMIAVFNWSDEPASVRAPLPAQPSYVFDVWNNADLDASRDAIDLDLPAHGCALLAVRLPVTGVGAGERPRRYPALLVPQPWT
jgi:alpha-galactosidase